MAKRYSKFHSNYILRKKHQESTKGTIWERDWVTIGAQHQIEKGKRVFYGDTNFLFTDNSYTSYKKRHNFSKWIGNWNYDEALDASSEEVNVVETNWFSNDLRDFAYYGSCVELIKNTVFDIVKWFPGRMTIGEDNLYVGETNGNPENGYYTDGKVLNNPFGLDLYRNVFDQNTDENLNRYVADTYYQYQVNGEDVVDYHVVKETPECLGRSIEKICEIAILTSIDKLYFIDGYDVFGDVIYVEGDSPYTVYYTAVNEDGTIANIFTNSFGPYTTPVYIHDDDLDKVYVCVINGEDGQEIALFSENDNKFFDKYFVATVNFGEGDVTHEYYRNPNGDRTEDDNVNYYCWSTLPEEPEDYSPNVYTKTENPNPDFDELYIEEEETESMIYAEATFSSYIVTPKFSGYATYGYQNGDDIISEEDYNNLSVEEQNNYTKIYWWVMSVEKYMNFNGILPEGYSIVLNTQENSDEGIELFFGEMGKIETLQENPENVKNYVNSLKYVDHILLNNKTNPLYRATLITPIETHNGYIYTEKFYTWPSVDGYIDVSSVAYDKYMSSLIEMATIFDDTWCDNLWRNMTHESIRNFDWTYTKDYTEGDEEAFIEGGLRMQEVIHIYGRIADELKRYIEGIKMTSTVSFNGYNNMPSAEMTDKLEYRGWDVFSIIPLFKVKTNEDNETEGERNEYDFSTIRIDESFIKSYIQKKQEFITESEYYQLPSESQSKYAFNYIRVSTNPNKGVLYDAVGADVITADEYENLSDEKKSEYTPRYQDVIITKETYDELGNEPNDFDVYQYRNTKNGEILLYNQYDSIDWQEDHEEDEVGYDKMRKGKEDYLPYSYRRKDVEVEEQPEQPITDEYVPYEVTIGDKVYPAVSFYPTEYRHIVSSETLTIYEYNQQVWQEDFFAFEYFIPEENGVYWVVQAKDDGLDKYAWKDIIVLDGNEREKYKPYRYLNKADGDTIITPEQYQSLPQKSEYVISKYGCTLDEDISVVAGENGLADYTSKYIKYNVITPEYYATLSDSEKVNFAPYMPMKTVNYDRWFNARSYDAETMGEQDVRFAKELMLLSKEIFATKGTRHGIDMIMSMFGFADSYTLKERYHCLSLEGHDYDYDVFTQLVAAATFNQPEQFYDDTEFPENTVPMGTVELHNIRYIIPYYDSKRSYAGGEVYFQSKGGWGHKSISSDDPQINAEIESAINVNEPYEYIETLSYLKVVDSVGSLLNVNARTVNNGDIYYVMSINDIVEYDEDPPEPEKLSHFFYINDDFNPQLYPSWTNIDMTSDSEEAEKARYLDGIISTSIGNNPHTGYGKYDLGATFLEYVKKPFKYYLDNYILDKDTRDIMDGNSATFDFETKVTEELNGKIKNVADCEIYNTSNIFETPQIEDNRYVDESDSDIEGSKRYYINDKVLIMTNKINNNFYKQYFFDVILHYLMQMIPSTTILILKDFNIE